MLFDRCFCLQVRNGLLAKLVKLSKSLQDYCADFNLSLSVITLLVLVQTRQSLFKQ